MKLSIAWIFDHIDAPWRSIDITDLVTRFNKTTAEIESVYSVSVDLTSIHAARVLRREHGLMHVEIIHALQVAQVALPHRTDLADGQWALVVQTDGTYRWALAIDCGGQRDFYMPVLQVDASSDWKTQIECDDYILTVDNKSITNRPDLWGHRGFAREIATILDLPLKSLDTFLASISVSLHERSYQGSNAQPWSVNREATNACSALAVGSIEKIAMQSSSVAMATRLARVDMRPINAVVDITNYVMYDIGQPMHAFDAHTLQSKTIAVRMAREKESLQILDRATIQLTAHDIVIVDGTRPISLAGIMGGLDTGITAATQAIVIEAGTFDATTIRHSAERHKLRTEASARFEKSLDSAQPVYALKRFVSLAHQIGLVMEDPKLITVVGHPAKTVTLSVAHTFIESRLGVSLVPAFVIHTLEKLAFGVTVHDGIYTIQVPTFRATKDITIAEDIVEEIGRFYGYDKIAPELPLMQLKPHDLTPIMRLRALKKYLAYAHQMTELYSYALYDESFLTQIHYTPRDTLNVQDPVSANWQCLVTSLIPHLSKAVAHNATTQDQLRFFEWGRTWQYDGQVTETKKLAGIIFNKRTAIDFYQGKIILEDMLRMLGLSVSWRQVTHPVDPWYTPYTTAELMYNEQSVGYVGIVPTQYMASVSEGHALVFELDGSFLIDTPAPVKRFVPSSKFPEVCRDVSVLIARQHSVTSLQECITQIDPRVICVTLVDFFEKEEWIDKRSLSFRYILADTTKTMTTAEVDAISEQIVYKLTALGGSIR